MNEIVRSPERQTIWDVFGGFDSLFDDLARSRRLFASGDAGQAITPAVDVTETDHEYLVKAELPGVKKEDLDVSIHDGTLTINAETKYERDEKKEGRVIRRERRYGQYVRSMRLGQDVDTAGVKADYRDGVLNLSLPKREEVKPKRVEVKIS